LGKGATYLAEKQIAVLQCEVSLKGGSRMTDIKLVKGVTTAVDTVVTDLHQPLILERDGQPVAVLVSFETYQQFRAWEEDAKQRQRIAWPRLEEQITEIHRRPSVYTSEEIEAEITAARAEAQEEWSAHHRGH
jgi:PHD/YefM family antitoxin component YafN of YafNO toxin-antitoxin module